MSREPQFIAWLNGCSVMRGTMEAVTAHAMGIYHSDLWRKFNGHRQTMLRITKANAYQTFVSETLLPSTDRPFKVPESKL